MSGIGAGTEPVKGTACFRRVRRSARHAQHLLRARHVPAQISSPQQIDRLEEGVDVHRDWLEVALELGQPRCHQVGIGRAEDQNRL
jgi:hypothetical protein